jgi:hypothetical protein
MRFFTRAWAEGKIPDVKANLIPREYESHIKMIWSQLPEKCRELAKEIHLHDGKIVNVSYSETDKKICISVKCGDLQNGYFDIDLIYSEIKFGEEIFHKTKDISSNAKHEILYDEVDLDQAGNIIHRILFWPNAEITITFKIFDFKKRKNANGRNNEE